MPLSPSTLTRLRAFGAVGRHLSFTRAAAELAVTPTALSHHVRHLENEVGAALVLRLHRRIDLTAEGRVLLDACTQGFGVLSHAMETLTRRTASTQLTISVAPYYSARWLTPRLSNFWSLHPGVELRLHHAYQPANFAFDRADAAIAWGPGRWPNVVAERVLEGTLTPLCSPSLRARLPKHVTPEELARFTLLYEFSIDHWRWWFRAAGASMPPGARAFQVDDSHALRKMTLEGEGIALFFTGLSREDRQLGLLVQPHDVTIDPGDAYYLTRPAHQPLGRGLVSFRDWLFDEITLDPCA